MKLNQPASRSTIILVIVIMIIIVGLILLIVFPPLPEELFNSENTVFVIPVMTANAYKDNGFYDYFEGKCGIECLTVTINPDEMLKFSSSKRVVDILGALHYSAITDYDVAGDPTILKKYDKVILLHSEYVTMGMFDSITSHKNVIYMFPNALYAEVILIGDKMTLVKGHGYPETSIENGFDWKYDNTHPDEFDDKCENWKFSKIDNGYQLNCYPDMVIKKRLDILKTLKEL